MSSKILFLLCFILISASQATSLSPKHSESLRPLMKTELRRKLNNFQVCAVCTCCGGRKRACVASPCCYAINCNIPNKPFGVCSFTPKACNCLGCHL